MARKYKQGLFKPKNPDKYVGDPDNIVYRSGYELKFLLYLDSHPDVLEYASEEIIVRYLSPVDKKWHRYFPDFLVKVREKDGKIRTKMIEIKPFAQTQKPKATNKKSKKVLTEMRTFAVNQAKWAYAKQWCQKRNIEFHIITEKDLF